jgi:hypothetical protein
MKILYPALLLLIVSISSLQFANGQVSVGLYSNGLLHQIAVGSNPQNKFFGEARFLAGDEYNRFFSLEGIGQIALKRSDWHDISGGLMVGYHGWSDQARIGLPFLLAIKPIEAHRNFAIMLEATPTYSYDIALRGSFGIRYTIGNR